MNIEHRTSNIEHRTWETGYGKIRCRGAMFLSSQVGRSTVARRDASAGRRLSAFLVRAGVAVVVAACVGCVKPPHIKAPYVSREEIAGRLEATAEKLGSFLAGVSIYADIKDFDKRGTVDAWLAMASGDRMRLRLRVLGRMFLDVTSDGTTLYAADMEEKVVHYGTLAELAEKNTFWKPATFRATFLAEPPGETFLLEKLGDHYVVIFYSDERIEGGVLRKLIIDRNELTVKRQIVYDTEGFVAMEIEYKRYREVEGVAIPEKIEALRPKDGSRLKLTLNTITFGARDGLFELSDDDETASWPRQPIEVDSP